MSIPKKHKAAVYDKPGTISTKIVEIDTPEPGPGQVLVNLTHSGVCHSDMGIMLRNWSTLPYPTPEGQVGGHEGVGKVAALGPQTETSGLKVGDRVGIKWITSACGSCPMCLRGHDGVCKNQQVSGYFHPGTFQQYVLSSANYVTRIPDGIDSASAAPLLCGGVTVYSALRKSGALSGDWIVVLGAGGGLGHLALQFGARGMGYRMIGVDHSSKKDLILESGAEHFLPIDGTDDVPAAVRELTDGLGAQVCLVVTANNKAYASALDTLRFGGRLVCVGIPEGTPVPIERAFPGPIIAKELSIVGVAVGDRRLANETMDFGARGIVKVHHRVAKLEDLTGIFEEMHEGKLQGRFVLDLS